MLTYTTVEDVRALIALSEAAAARADRLVDRVSGTDLQASAEAPELDGLAPLGATTMAAPLQALETRLAGLSPEARRELRAIGLVGAGEFAARQWDEALLAAESRQTESEAGAMAENADLAPQLAKGLYLLKLA